MNKSSHEGGLSKELRASALVLYQINYFTRVLGQSSDLGNAGDKRSGSATSHLENPMTDMSDGKMKRNLLFSVATLGDRRTNILSLVFRRTDENPRII